jgi:cytochrome P450
MNKRRFLVAVIVSVLVAVALVIVRGSPERDDIPEPVLRSAGVTAAQQAAWRQAESRLARVAPAAARARVGKFSGEMLQSAEDKFRRMIAFRGLITQDKERRSLAQDVLALPDGADLMRTILVDPAFARSAFGQFQAEARFYAITVLDEAARQGRGELVADVAAELGTQLAAVTGELDRGRADDLRGVMVVIGRSLGSRGMEDAHSPKLARLGLTASVPQQVRQLYLEGLLYGIWKVEPFEQAMAAVERIQNTL